MRKLSPSIGKKTEAHVHGFLAFAKQMLLTCAAARMDENYRNINFSDSKKPTRQRRVGFAVYAALLVRIVPLTGRQISSDSA